MADQILQENEDFKVELTSWQGKPAVKKSIKETTSAERAERLPNEVYGMQFMADLAAKHPELHLYIPKLYESTNTYLIREYIDAKNVVEPDMPSAEINSRLDKLAQFLGKLDHIEPYGETKFVGHFDYHDIRKNTAKWAKDPLEASMITQAQVDRLNQLLEPLLKYVQPRISHGDFSPHRHSFITDDGKIGLIDLENFTPAGARYYDVARSYVRLYSFEPSTDTAKHFLAAFLKYADQVPHKEEQLMAIILQRTLGMQYDAWYDAEHQGLDYKPRAAELLDLVLQNNLELLHK